jgi:hypothetical protein
MSLVDEVEDGDAAAHLIMVAQMDFSNKSVPMIQAWKCKYEDGMALIIRMM